MLARINRHIILVVAVLAVGSLGPRAASAGCPCNTDVDNINGTNVIDIAVANDCALGNCAGCVNDCDVNCDGTVDFIDPGVVTCEFQGFADCCNHPTGACTGAKNMTPCAVTLVSACDLMQGTYHGDGTFCDGDNVVNVPAASQWGLASLGLAILVAATVLIRARRRPCAD